MYNSTVLAALLHDCGHYPFSHAMEEALRDHHSSSLLEGGDGSEQADTSAPLDHEQVGKEVISSDPDVARILKAAKFEPKKISDIFTREQPPKFANLVSSDLDADRTDYLVRTAHATGLPYGSVDVEYLRERLTLDEEDKLCISPNAIRTADHFLLSRFFDYQQVSFHKTVAGLELVLKDVLDYLLKRKLLDCSSSSVKRMIEKREWSGFDNTFVLSKMRQLEEETQDSDLGLKLESLLRRNPPRLVGSIEYLDHRDRKNEFKKTCTMIKERLAEWSERFGIPTNRWYHWSKSGIRLTSLGATIPASGGEPDAEAEEQSIRILDRRSRKSRPISQDKRSLMSVLADQALFATRVYVLLAPEDLDKRGEIEQALRDDLPVHGWI